jgi:hypothetical protein
MYNTDSCQAIKDDIHLAHEVAEIAIGYFDLV